MTTVDATANSDIISSEETRNIVKLAQAAGLTAAQTLGYLNERGYVTPPMTAAEFELAFAYELSNGAAEIQLKLFCHLYNTVQEETGYAAIRGGVALMAGVAENANATRSRVSEHESAKKTLEAKLERMANRIEANVIAPPFRRA